MNGSVRPSGGPYSAQVTENATVWDAPEFQFALDRYRNALPCWTREIDSPPTHLSAPTKAVLKNRWPPHSAPVENHSCHNHSAADRHHCECGGAKYGCPTAPARCRQKRRDRYAHL